MNRQNTPFFEKIHVLEGAHPDLQKKLKRICRKLEQQNATFSVKTSGSTGKPKTVIFAKETLIRSANLTISTFGLRENSNALMCLPIHTIGGLMMLVRAYVGNFNLLVAQPSSKPLSQLPHEISLDFCSFTPHQLYQMLTDERKQEYIHNLQKCKCILVGGGGISAKLEQLICENSISVLQTYGMTETASHIAYRKVGYLCTEPYFKLLPGYEIRVDTEGCLHIKGFATKQKWLATRDLATIVSPSQFLINGRADWVINSGGIKWNLLELERKLSEFFILQGLDNRIILCAEPDDTYGQRLVLIVEAHPLGETLLHKMNTYIKTYVHAYVVPKKIYFLPSFVMTPSGKIDRISTHKLAMSAAC